LCCEAAAAGKNRILDVHQHTVYGQRDGEQLVLHQRAMGVTVTVLLPVGTPPGLAAGAGGKASVLELARKHAGEYIFIAIARPGTRETRLEIEKYLALGGLGIGEQKFPFECDSAAMQEIYSIEHERQIPVLLHFKQDEFNRGLERFHTMAAKYSRAKFFGHTESCWGNIDRDAGWNLGPAAGRVS
jgi:hypothetical protein